ncbi:MAG: glutamine amidotransferase [Christensenellaceae bacterium]
MMKVLFVGESWITQESHVKGWDLVTLCRSEERVAVDAMNALEQAGIEIDYVSNADLHRLFPETVEELKKYSAIIMSDVGSNTMTQHPEVQFKSLRKQNNLLNIKEYVAQGGGLLMFGGYMSFSGIENKARYAMTPLAEVLPVTMLHYDDRMEHPEGVYPEVKIKNHVMLDGVNAKKWPYILGYNLIQAKPQAEEVLTVEGNTLLAGMDYGKGRSIAFSTDCAPHWMPSEFSTWEGFQKLLPNMVKWLAKEI